MVANSATVALIVLISTILCGSGSTQEPACVSRRAGSVPAAYAATVAQERTLVCERLATRIPGVQVAVAVNGRLVWSEGFGYADAERKKPVTRETQFRIGSVSKPLTAAAVALLYEQRKLDLDAPVQRYVPSFPDKGYPITTRQLTGHLAGIRHYKGEEFLLNRRFATVLDGLTIFQDDSLLFPPGTRFSYSSYAWNLVSAVVEGASGEDFLRYMAAHVFRPLGLTRTAPDRADSLIPGRTQFYDRDTVGGYRVAPAVDNSYKWAGGGFVSTAEDLVKFGSALLEPGFLKRETLELLFTSQHTSGGGGDGLRDRVVREDRQLGASLGVPRRRLRRRNDRVRPGSRFTCGRRDSHQSDRCAARPGPGDPSGIRPVRCVAAQAAARQYR